MAFSKKKLSPHRLLGGEWILKGTSRLNLVHQEGRWRAGCSSSIFISQSKYANNLVKKFGLKSACLVRTPMSPNVKLIVDLLEKSVDPTLYRSMIGSLLYLTTSRFDISYSVGVCACYQANAKESHVTIVKRIIKYVKSTSNYVVWYDKDTNEVLAWYFDAYRASNVDDHKSTSSGCFYLGNNIVSWMSKKQNSISLSTVEAEYIAASS
ncbi:secreted RxLR effector protein 161-like [Castanea sativa]|uniref:secreted RxLR effector protein 161-like n=1 Tax=Castanea sativa TaxID=21020 RepID=UPI003F64E2AC